MADADDAQWAEFEKVGETTVRQNLAANRYGEGKQKLAEAWLHIKNQSRVDTAMREQTDFARAASAAARDAASEARTANTNARIANAIAVTAVIVAIIALFLK